MSVLTRTVIVEYSGRDDFATRCEQALQVALTHVLRYSADVQIGTFYAFAALAGVRHLKYTMDILLVEQK